MPLHSRAEVQSALADVVNTICQALLLGGQTCGAGAARGSVSLGSVRAERMQRRRGESIAPRAAGEGLDREDPNLKETFATVG